MNKLIIKKFRDILSFENLPHLIKKIGSIMNNKNEPCNIHQTYYGFITLNPSNESTTED